jgi:hypothetical protein
VPLSLSVGSAGNADAFGQLQIEAANWAMNVLRSSKPYRPSMFDLIGLYFATLFSHLLKVILGTLQYILRTSFVTTAREFLGVEKGKGFGGEGSVQELPPIREAFFGWWIPRWPLATVVAKDSVLMLQVNLVCMIVLLSCLLPIVGRSSPRRAPGRRRIIVSSSWSWLKSSRKNDPAMDRSRSSSLGC